jgi:hypothetical protein
MIVFSEQAVGHENRRRIINESGRKKAEQVTG